MANDWSYCVHTATLDLKRTFATLHLYVSYVLSTPNAGISFTRQALKTPFKAPISDLEYSSHITAPATSMP
jgi:hypothetical protein